MKVEYSSVFLKHFKKRLSSSAKDKFYQRLYLFEENPKDPVLRDHKLMGEKANLRSFSVTGDIRVIYSIKGDTMYFVEIGTHNQIY